MRVAIGSIVLYRGGGGVETELKAFIGLGNFSGV